MKDTVKKIIKKICEIIKVSSSDDISKDVTVSEIFIEGSIRSYSNHRITYKLPNKGHETFYIDVDVCRRKSELFEYIDELNENFVMLDTYIRKKLKNEYPELFI